jgi:Icc-related predicted phosphoesterase
MIIAATSDIGLPKNYHEFFHAVDGMERRPDLFLVAGDVVHHGEIEEYDRFYNIMFGKMSCPIVACFGNNEFQQLRDGVRSKYRDITFLDDQSTIVKIDGTQVGVFGTTGSLETPTPWQLANIPNIENIFRQRIDLADKALHRMQADFKILLTHYAPTYRTLEGENPRFYSSLGSQIYENVINARKPGLVIHGHSHRGIRQAWIETVPVFNVAFPLNKRIVIIDTNELRPGLAKFV